jgi:hypothetical protein
MPAIFSEFTKTESQEPFIQTPCRINIPNPMPEILFEWQNFPSPLSVPRIIGFEISRYETSPFRNRGAFIT